MTTEIHTVEITTQNGNVLRYYVEHRTPAAAKAWLLKNRVTATVATQQDIIAMVRDGIEPIGPEESHE